MRMKLVLLFFTPFKRPHPLCPQPYGLDVRVVYHPRALPCPALDQQCPVSFPGTKGAWIKIDTSEMLKIVSLSTQLARQWQNTRDRSGEEGGIRGVRVSRAADFGGVVSAFSNSCWVWGIRFHSYKNKKMDGSAVGPSSSFREPNSLTVMFTTCQACWFFGLQQADMYTANTFHIITTTSN